MSPRGSMRFTRAVRLTARDQDQSELADGKGFALRQDLGRGAGIAFVAGKKTAVIPLLSVKRRVFSGVPSPRDFRAAFLRNLFPADDPECRSDRAIRSARPISISRVRDRLRRRSEFFSRA